MSVLYHYTILGSIWNLHFEGLLVNPSHFFAGWRLMGSVLVSVILLFKKSNLLLDNMGLSYH